MKVAYFSPVAPERSGIADYSALLLPALRRRVEVAVMRRGAKRPARGTDVALYHVGNNPDAHGWIVDALRRYPGVVVLHEFVLHHLIAGITLGRGDGHAYLDAMQRDAGVAGRLLAHGVIDGVVPPPWETRPHEFPLAAEILGYATGLVVHSRYVERRAREAGYAGPVWRVPHPSWPVPGELGDPELPEGRRPVIGCFGNLNPSKRLPVLLEAFARLASHRPGALLVLAGAASRGLGLEAWIDRLGLARGQDVILLDYVEEDRLWALAAACDVCVSLRWPTMGETSGSAIRALSLGRPLVVSDVGWFSELPDSVAAKVPVDPWEQETLASVLALLVDDGGLRERMSAAALAYVRLEHALDRVAEGYVVALEEAAGGERVRHELLVEFARAAGEVGIESSSAELTELARRLREVGV